MKGRIEYFDFLRGVCIIFVVCIHAFTGYISSVGIFASTNFDYNSFIRLAIGGAVAMFIAISGYFMANKQLYNKQFYLKFEKKQIARVYFPCLIWSLPYFVISIYQGSPFVKEILNLFSGAYSVYYFITVIIQFYILLPLFQRLVVRGNLYGIILCFVFNTISVIIIQYILYVQKIDLPLILYAGFFLIWILFFVTGVYYGKGYILKIKWRYLIFFVVLFLFLNYIESYCLYKQFGNVESIGIRKVSWVFYSFTLIVIMFKLKENYHTNNCFACVAKLGEYSFGVYLIHMYILFIFNKFYPDLYWVFKAIICLFISSVIVWGGRSFFSKFSVKYLGF